MTGGRYAVHAKWPDGTVEFVGASDDLTKANRLMLAAMHEGAILPSQTDTQPGVPLVTPEERAAVPVLPRQTLFE
ncbi:MAG: hypothetical protein WDN04_13820 [Rhodospirillales bacterium]